MAIFTPRGLKIRVATEHAFALMARLHPRVDSFTILKTAEGFELLPAAITLLVGLASFTLKAGLVPIAVAVAVVSIFTRTIVYLGVPLPAWLVRIGTAYSLLSGYGVFLLCVFAVGFPTVGWKGIAAYFVGKAVGGIVNSVVEMKSSWSSYESGGSALTGSEVSFFRAYIMHAKCLGASCDLKVSEQELQSMKWRETLNDLTLKWPEVVARFTVD